MDEKTIKKSWKSLTWLKDSKKEFDRYKKKKNPEELAQAGEKLYNSMTLYLDEKLGIRLKNYKQIKEAAASDKDIKKIFDDAYWLHVFFYRGYTDDISNEEDKFKRVYKFLEKVI
jgi:hypothetical protein